MRISDRRMKATSAGEESHLRPLKNLARSIDWKKAPVIFERSERSDLNAGPLPVKKWPRMPCRFFAALKNDGCRTARE